jgi:chromate transporter
MSRAPERSESAGSTRADPAPRRSTDERPTVLFVCEHGSARSAMAAALLRVEMGDEVRVLSAGPDPDPTMNPLAMAALDEAGVAVPAVPPTQLTDTLLREADLVVSINRDVLPTAGSQQRWPVSRTPVKTAQAARAIRDELAERVRDLAADLRANPLEAGSLRDGRSEPSSSTAASGGTAGSRRDLVPFGEAVRTWFLISLQTFGGPAGQIAVMQRTLVDEKRWIGQRRFLHALNYCMLLPGPEAQQLAIYTGWLLNGTRGGLVAGTLFVVPGVVALLALSAIYVAFGNATAVTALFAGLAPAVLAIVAQAVVRVGKRALAHPALVALAVAAFLALGVFAVPFPVVVAGAAAVGWLLGRFAPQTLRAADGHGGADSGPAPLIPDDALHAERPTGTRALAVLSTGLLLWLAPLAAVALLAGPDSVLTQQGLFFSGTAVVTFGGAYAVLAYVAQRAVEVYGWLAPGEMVRGLALAETTPGPLIMVVQFVAFVGAYRHPGGLDPWIAALLGALLTTWVTFVPCFLFIFLGAPYVERLRGNHALSAALTGITAAVVGVIANLAVYFAMHTLFAQTTELRWGPVHLDLPQLTSIRPLAVAITAAAVVMIFRLRWSVLRTLGACALLGLGAALLGLPVS